MKYILSDREPKLMLKYFEDISEIPRGSGNEKGIAEFICDFAKKRDLFYYTDEYNNVFIRKEATKGYENMPAVMLQGHTDMVCEKNADSDHDFLKDPLDLYVDEKGFLRAKGTTLGGDDGAAVAAMLAILDRNDIEHPTLECLFTTSEETGMDGAENFDCSLITAKKIINLDTEKDGEAIASCAGSAYVKYTLPFDYLKCERHILKIAVTGLSGGHSGADINTGRMNANRVMGRILARLYKETPFNLVDIKGGNMMNAIARECFASIVPEDIEEAQKIVYDEAEKIAKETVKEDKGLRITASKGRIEKQMASFKDTSALINMLTLPNNGVISYSGSEGFVRTSTNNGMVFVKDGVINVFFMPRSSCDPELSFLLLQFERLAKTIGCECETGGRAPGWDYNPDSELARSFVKCYKELYPGSDPYVTAIHAGLECGLFVSKTGADAISIGPTMYAIHSPDESLDLDSCERFFNLLLKMIADK